MTWSDQLSISGLPNQYHTSGFLTCHPPFVSEPLWPLEALIAVPCRTEFRLHLPTFRTFRRGMKLIQCTWQQADDGQGYICMVSSDLRLQNGRGSDNLDIYIYKPTGNNYFEVQSLMWKKFWLWIRSNLKLIQHEPGICFFWLTKLSWIYAFIYIYVYIYTYIFNTYTCLFALFLDYCIYLYRSSWCLNGIHSPLGKPGAHRVAKTLENKLFSQLA